ncbi:1006_t:CDS:2, partial [Ambispora leptoticha]
MDPKARLAVNLSVLRRHDKNIVEIIDSSSHVVVYKFDTQTTSWTKKGVEGTLFVFKRCIQPVYGFIVMNRVGIDNFVASLTDNMDIESKNGYIIYKADKGEIHGIWTFEEKDRDRIVNQLLLCCKESKTVIPPPQLAESPQISNSTTNSTTPPSQSYGRSIDLLTLFQQAGTKQTNGTHTETTSNGINHGTANGSTTLRQPTPSSNHVSERDILNELFLKANVNESRREAPPATSKNFPSTNGQQLDGKSLLELLRPPATHTSSTPQSKSTNNSSNPLLITPPQKSLSSLPINSLNYNTNNSIYTTKTSSNSLSVGEAPNLSRTQALNVSIASLPKMTRGQQNLVDGINILSRNEFEQRYIRMVQNDPSFMDTLYENYKINVQNMN